MGQGHGAEISVVASFGAGSRHRSEERAQVINTCPWTHLWALIKCHGQSWLLRFPVTKPACSSHGHGPSMVKPAVVLGFTLQRGIMLGAKLDSGMENHLVPGCPLVLELCNGGYSWRWDGDTTFSCFTSFVCSPALGKRMRQVPPAPAGWLM